MDYGFSNCQKAGRLVGKTPIFSNEVFFEASKARQKTVKI
jgi:hypothetical protein